jgi:hypothetical protein
VLRNAPGGFRMRPAVRSAVGLALACHLLYAYAYKINQDKASLAIRALEGLERQGRVSPAAMTNAPFGFLGFKLFPLLKEDYPGREVADFSCYVQAEGVVVESGLPWRDGFLAAPPEGAEILATGHARIGFRMLPYRVVDRKNPKGGTLCHRPFRYDARMRPGARPLPLDNAEWSRFAEGMR